MKKTKTLDEALNITKQLIDDIIFMCETRTKITYFTRTGKMVFKNIILFILNFVKKSIQIELDLFFKNINEKDESITKQGYSQARQKIAPTAFIKMADAIITWFYKDDDFKTFRGYRLCAIDGTILQVGSSKELKEEFDCVNNSNINIALGLASGIYDIENDMMLTSKITKYTKGERALAIELIEQLKNIGLKNDLILFDRGYPSSELIKYLDNNDIKYLMRASSSFFKAVNEAKKEDQVVDVKIDKESVKIRVIRFILESGEEEILITNLIHEDYGIKDFKELYFRRWTIETKFDEIKNRLQIENFTGTTALAVKQDFYASIYLSNMVSIAKLEANQKIEQKNEGKNLKYEYKVNANILIGKLKDSLVMALLEGNSRKRKKMLSKIMEEISRNTIPIRHGRSNLRKMGIRAIKYPQNQKRCL
jgi:hypothetical protein